MSLMYNVLILDRERLKLWHPYIIEMIANKPEPWKFCCLVFREFFVFGHLSQAGSCSYMCEISSKLLMAKWFENSEFRSLLQSPVQIGLSPLVKNETALYYYYIKPLYRQHTLCCQQTYIGAVTDPTKSTFWLHSVCRPEERRKMQRESIVPLQS